MRQKLKRLIEAGSDIEFTLYGVPYTILPWTEEGILIGPQNSDNDEAFESADALIDGYCVSGKPLCEHLSKLVLNFSA